jgi:hypothetical protein
MLEDEAKPIDQEGEGAQHDVTRRGVTRYAIGWPLSPKGFLTRHPTKKLVRSRSSSTASSLPGRRP